MTSVKNEAHMRKIGEQLGTCLRGGEVIELIGDVGAGKTTLVKGIGTGLRVDDDVQSPSFTISRVYAARDDLELHHYDFYRLQDAGVMKYELAESIQSPQAVTVIEWAGTVEDVLPQDHIVIRLNYVPEGEGRSIELLHSDAYNYVGIA